MSEDEYDEELPPISVNPRTQDASKFIMPSADILASQRAREEKCNHELKLLRELHTSDDQQGSQVEIPITNSDSSGSEGESGLAAAVDALRMQSGNTSSHMSVDLVNLISQLLKYLPESDTQFMHDYLVVLQQGNPAVIKYLNQEMLAGIEAALESEHSVWDTASALCCCVWLCALCVSGTGQGLRLRRALHALLQHASNEQVEELGRIMSETLRCPQLLLELSDAVQGAAGAPRSLANRLVQLALDEADGYTRVQLAGRAAAAGAPLAALPYARRSCTTTTEHLKVAVGASKLQLLFRTKK